MKPIVVTMRLQCRDDVPDLALELMAEHLAEYASRTFGMDYDPEVTLLGYDGSPLLKSFVAADAALDMDAIENDRVWRRMGAPPSSVTKHDPGEVDP